MKSIITALATTTVLVAVASKASAEVVLAQPPPTPVTAERTSVRPDLALVGSGMTGLVAGYVPALIVAIESNHQGDDRLFIPVVGPWFDILRRGCDAGEILNCGTTPIDAAALIVDGVVQDFGALQVLSALFAPEQRAVVVTAGSKPQLRVAPSAFGGRGYGVSAVGRF